MMANRNSGDRSCDQSILGLSTKTVRTINFLAVMAGVAGIVIGFVTTSQQLRMQQQQQKLQLNIAVGNLAAQENPEITSPFVHNNLKWMYRNDFPMTGIAVPDTKFYMAAFENVDWQEVNMNSAEFSCSDQVYNKINDWRKGEPKISLCALLRGANFAGASLGKARFHYADLRRADFTAATLSRANFRDSFISDAKFLEGVTLRGIKIENSDLTRAAFSSEAKFRCTPMNKRCTRLRRSDFSSAKLNDVLFRGTEVNRVDFSGAKLKKVRFDCEKKRSGKRPCTILKSVCMQSKDNALTELAGARFEGATIKNVNFRGAVLTKTKFKDTTISITDFTGADLAGASFINVKFDRVVLTAEQEAAAQFKDKASRESLHKARRGALVLKQGDEIPCSPDWNRDIKGWRDRFALAE